MTDCFGNLRPKLATTSRCVFMHACMKTNFGHLCLSRFVMHACDMNQQFGHLSMCASENCVFILFFVNNIFDILLLYLYILLEYEYMENKIQKIYRWRTWYT